MTARVWIDIARADAGWHVGLRRGLRGRRRGAVLDPPPPDFREFPRLPRREEARLVVVNEPNAPVREDADAGRAVHVVTIGDVHRVDYADGIWTRTVPAGPLWLPELGADPRARTGDVVFEAVDYVTRLRADVERIAALRGGVLASSAGAADLPGWPDELPESARSRLEEPERWPVDWEAVARIVLASGDPADVAGRAYRLLLGREPEPLGLAGLTSALRSGRDVREVLADLLDGVEARGRGIDSAVADRLPLWRTGVSRALRRAWQLQDAGFVAELIELLGPVGDATTATSRLRRGLPRHALVREWLDTASAQERMFSIEDAVPIDVLTQAELRVRLAALRKLPAHDFVAGAYRILLGRPAGPDAQPYIDSISAGGDRGDLLRLVAGSEEADAYGVRSEIVEAILLNSPYRRDAWVRRLRARTARLSHGLVRAR